MSAEGIEVNLEKGEHVLSADTVRATIIPAPKGKVTRRWRAYAVLTAVWFAAALVSLFFPVENPAYKVSHSIAYLSVAILAFWVLRPPVKYQEATK